MVGLWCSTDPGSPPHYTAVYPMDPNNVSSSDGSHLKVECVLEVCLEFWKRSPLSDAMQCAVLELQWRERITG